MVAHEPNSPEPSSPADSVQDSNQANAANQAATVTISQAQNTSAPHASDELLQSLLNHLVVRVRREQLETWFRSLISARSDESEVELSVTSQFVRDWLAKNYLSELQAAINAIDPDSSSKDSNRRLVLTYRAEDGQALC